MDNIAHSEQASRISDAFGSMIGSNKTSAVAHSLQECWAKSAPTDIEHIGFWLGAVASLLSIFEKLSAPGGGKGGAPML
jgi:hypothetical protein